MSTVEIIYEAKCKHCLNMKYYFKGKRKFHKCIVKDFNVTLKDKPWCGLKDFELNPNGSPNKLML